MKVYTAKTIHRNYYTLLKVYTVDLRLFLHYQAPAYTGADVLRWGKLCMLYTGGLA